MTGLRVIGRSRAIRCFGSVVWPRFNILVN